MTDGNNDSDSDDWEDDNVPAYDPTQKALQNNILPQGLTPAQHGGASASEPNNEESIEIDDDEDFDLETPNRTQSLGMNFYLLYHTQRARKFKKVQAKKKL